MSPRDPNEPSLRSAQRSPMQSIIKHDRVQLESDASAPRGALPQPSGAPAQRAAARCKKTVELLREKDVVHAIEVRCSCGETTVIELEYGPEHGAGA